MLFLNDDLVGASLYRQVNGSSSPYWFDTCLINIDQVLLSSLEEDKIYFTIEYILLSGFVQTEKKREKTSLCILASMGISPVRKCIPALDACLLTFNTPFKAFL